MPHLEAAWLRALHELAPAPPRPVAALRAAVAAHHRAIAEAAAASPFVDGSRAAAVAAACDALLDAWPSLSAEHQRLVQAACVYFANPDDDEGDFASIIGFEDDVEVIRYVSQAIGRPDPTLE